ncbi:MAG: hypothetical protein PVJ49_13550 [Acidobacteriota bacterium]|jgi:hypothetical protein
MTSSTEHFDELLEWHPGTADAARGNVLAAFVWGVRRAGSAKLLLLVLWLLYVALELGAAGLLVEVLRAPDFAREAFHRLMLSAGAGGIVGLPAAQASYRAAIFISPTRALWVPTPYFFLLYAFVAGGAISYLHSPRQAPFLAQLSAACGRYAGRFTRLLLLQGALFGLFAAIIEAAPFAEPGAALLWVEVGTTVIAMAVVAAICDYGRVRTVARDSRSMVIELARSAGFFLRNLPRTVALELLLLLATVITANLALVLNAALRLLLQDSTAAAVAGQLLVLSLLWLRLVAWGAMLSLYQGLTLEALRQSS